MNRRWLFSLLVFLFFVLLGYGMLKVLAGLWIREGFPPEQYAEMKEYFNTPVDLPKDFFETRTYPQEIRDAGEEINRLYKECAVDQIDFLALNDLKNGAELLEAEWGQIDSDVKKIQPFLDKLIPYVRMPGYEISAWPVDKIDPESNVPNFLSIQVSAKALLLRAYASANQKNWKDSFEASGSAYELTKRTLAGTLIQHLVSIAVQCMASDAMNKIVPSCNEVETLKNALNEMNRLDAMINLNQLKNARILDLIAGLNEFKKTDSSIDLTPGKPGRFYFRQMVDFVAQKERNQRWPEKFPELWVIKLGRSLGFGSEIDALLFTILSPNMESALIRERTAISQYRIVQVTLASRIEELTTGKEISRVADLVPAYFPKEPVDPFAETGKSSAFLYDATKKTFYGIGPDLKDDKNQVIYDPSNGIISTGDISAAWK